MKTIPQNTKIKTEKWFLNRIGKRIFRDDRKCCSTCERVYKDGVIVNDEQHARYIYQVQCDFANEGIFLNYRDFRY